MRVFTQLMMRNKMKVEEMPLTVVGSPTITDGVVSGFSENNYLQISTLDFGTNIFEIKFKFKILDFNSASDIMFGTSFGLGIRIRTDKKIIVYIGNGGWNIINGASSSLTLNENIDYFLKVIFSGTYYVFEISTDDINYENYVTVNSTSNINITSYNIGTNYNASDNYFSGSIDINNSYIKIGETKYIFTLPQS